MTNWKLHYQKYGKEWQQKNRKKCREKGRKFYWKYRDKILLKKKRKDKEKRNFIQDYKLKKGCDVCGYKKSANALCFHHTKKNKEFHIADSIGGCISLERIKKEIEKCQVVCHNCHAEIHEANNEYA